MNLIETDLSITGLSAAYKNGAFAPADLLKSIRERAEELTEYNIYITLLSAEQIQIYLDALAQMDPLITPLWGIPFTLKDNIDLAQVNTTAACEAFTYVPDTSATVVERLLAAGAIPVGKANLDQFATGLNGTRSPWGPCRNSFDSAFVSGGSSAGSAVSVAMGLSSFSLGTDTAGSGRVPAGFNNLVGLKPTRGLVPATGVVPACRSLDCVSIFAFNADDANTVLSVAEGLDEEDAYSRSNTFDNRPQYYGYRSGGVRVGILKENDLRFFEDETYAHAYAKTLSTLAAEGFELVPIDYGAFNEVALLLYEGPWVAERYIATTPLIKDNPGALDPTVRAIIEPGGLPLATELFEAEYRLNRLKRKCAGILAEFDCLLTPTAGRHFTIDEMLANPIVHNSELGYYTNFVNLLDLAAVSVPAILTETGRPFGITLVGPTFSDRDLLSVANRIQHILPLPMGALQASQPVLNASATGSSRMIDIVVCGAHMDKLPLNTQLTLRGATFSEATKTASKYALYKLPGDSPLRPALVEDEQNGQAIDVEVWSIPATELGSFVKCIPAPLGIGKITMSDGRELSGFVCTEGGTHGAENITAYGGWRAYISDSAVIT